MFDQGVAHRGGRDPKDLHKKSAKQRRNDKGADDDDRHLPQPIERVLACATLSTLDVFDRGAVSDWHSYTFFARSTAAHSRFPFLLLP